MTTSPEDHWSGFNPWASTRTRATSSSSSILSNSAPTSCSVASQQVSLPFLISLALVSARPFVSTTAPRATVWPSTLSFTMECRVAAETGANARSVSSPLRKRYLGSVGELGASCAEASRTSDPRPIPNPTAKPLRFERNRFGLMAFWRRSLDGILLLVVSRISFEFYAQGHQFGAAFDFKIQCFSRSGLGQPATKRCRYLNLAIIYLKHQVI